MGIQRESWSSRSRHASVVPIALTSAWFIQRKSNTGRSERIGGSQLKLWPTGGDVVAHSNELAPHGSAPSVIGDRNVRTRLITKGITEMTWITRPTDAIVLSSGTSSTSG